MEAFTYLEDVTFRGLLGLLVGVCVVMACARALLSVLRLEGIPAARLVCAYWVAAGAVVNGSVLLAGKTGLLSWSGILGLQAAFLAVLLAVWRGRLDAGGLLRLMGQDLSQMAGAAGAHLQAKRWKDGPEWWVPLVFRTLAVLLLVLAAVAVLTPVVNHDTHIYRFPRIGMWLQNNHIGPFETPKSHMNFTGRTAEFLLLWMVSFFKSGFPFAQGVQWLAGVATLAATYELARLLEFPRLARWAAVFVLLGMPNVLVQFTTSQTDLVAASFATAGLVFVHEGFRLRQGGSFILAGMAFGLAVGTKQTMLVWGAAYAVPALVWGVKSSAGIKELARFALCAVLASLPFYLVLFWENRQTYGAWLVPAEFLQTYASLRPEEQVAALFYPAIWIWHLSWPDVQSPFLFPLAQWMHEHSLALAQQSVLSGLEGGLPKCAAELKEWMASGRFGEDIVPPSLAVLGAVALALPLAPLLLFRSWRGRLRLLELPGLPFLLASWVAVLCSLRFGWEIYSWRFWAIPAPLLVLAALSLPSLFFPGSLRISACWAVLFLALHLPVALRGMWQHGNNGLLTLFQPERAQSRFYAGLMAETAAVFDRKPRRIFCGEERFWSSILFRGKEKHEVVFAMPRKDNPLRNLELGNCDVAILRSPKSLDPSRHLAFPIPALFGEPLWAVRLAGPGEELRQAFWKEGHFDDGWIASSAALQVGQWQSGQIHISFQSLHAQPLALEVSGKKARQTLVLPPHQWFAAVLPVAPEDELQFRAALPFIPKPPDSRKLGVLVRIDETPPVF
jgi:hypothetical protein